MLVKNNGLLVELIAGNEVEIARLYNKLTGRAYFDREDELSKYEVAVLKKDYRGEWEILKGTRAFRELAMNHADIGEIIKITTISRDKMYWLACWNRIFKEKNGSHSFFRKTYDKGLWEFYRELFFHKFK